MAFFIDLMQVMGHSSGQASENLHELRNNYQFWYEDVGIFTLLEELRRKAAETINLTPEHHPPAPWQSIIKKLSDTRSLCESSNNNLLNGNYNATPRKGAFGMPLIFQPVRQSLNRQLEKKRELFVKLIDYHLMLQGEQPDVKMFCLALFLNWASTAPFRKAGKPQDDYRCHLKQQMKLISGLLNGLRHHKGLSKLVGYFWVTMQDARGKPYIRLHLYVPENNYTKEMLLSIINRWLAIAGEAGGVSHKHTNILQKHSYRLAKDLAPFTIEEDISRVNHFGKKLSSAQSQASLTAEYYLESLAKRVMFWPGCKSYYLSKALNQ